MQRDVNRLRVTGVDPRLSLDTIRDVVASEQARIRRVGTDRRTLEDLFTQAPA